jgi:hypothetical protein
MIIPIARYFCSNTCECNLDSQDISTAKRRDFYGEERIGRPISTTSADPRFLPVRDMFGHIIVSYLSSHRTLLRFTISTAYLFILGKAVTLVASPCDVI